MANERYVICPEYQLIAIADAIREKRGEEDTYYLYEMPSAIKAIQSAFLQSKTANWYNYTGGGALTLTADEEYDGLENVEIVFPAVQSSKTVSPSAIPQTINPDNGYDVLSSVVVEAISSNYKDVSGVTAAAAQVLSGYNIMTTSGLVSGTMVNNGAVSAILGSGVTSYTIPEGYHNGNGVVTYNKKVATLNSSYPQDISIFASSSNSATFKVVIATDGEPASYTYQWYKNSSAVSGANGATFTLTNQSTIGTYSIYCAVTNDAGTVTSRVATFTVKNSLPTYSYSGTSSLIDDGSGNWRLKFLTSGTLTFSDVGNGSSIDVFLVGGGGGGQKWEDGCGGGGGYTTTFTGMTSTVCNTAYPIVIGAGGSGGSSCSAGGTTSAFGLTATGGNIGEAPVPDSNYGGKGGAGGSGGGAGVTHGKAGSGGSDGGNGGSAVAEYGTSCSGGAGQLITTREFGESSGTLYAGGGGGGARDGSAGSGGSGGGGKYGSSGTVNTGGGGGGTASGGSGIVVIRNSR